MPKLTAHVSLWRDAQPVHLVPGDDLPDWAQDLVGDHVLSDVEAPAESESEDPEGSDTSDVEAQAEQPDFTAPAARRGRPRKQA